MIDYLNEFETLCNKIKDFEMELLSAVLAYCLFKGANIAEDKQQLTQTTINEMTHKSMKKQLKTIFDSLSCVSSTDKNVPIKVEYFLWKH